MPSLTCGHSHLEKEMSLCPLQAKTQRLSDMTGLTRGHTALKRVRIQTQDVTASFTADRDHRMTSAQKYKSCTGNALGLTTPHIVDKEAEGQRREMSCPRSPIQDTG